MLDPDYDKLSPLEVIIIFALLAVLLGLLAVMPADAQDCVDDASDHRLRLEMAERGYERWGCWTQYKVMCRWDGAPDPEGDDLFELQVRGRGALVSITRTYHIVAADSLLTWWPAGCDTLDGRVRAFDPDGYSDWSDWGDVFIISR